MRIIGAGMAGLLAAHMLRRHRPHLLEAQSSLPNNHSALLRFRTDAASRATGIPFKKVWVTKGFVDREGNIWNGRDITIADANRYAFKVTGELLPRSILNLEPGERYVAPSNFILQLADGLDIEFDARWFAPTTPESAMEEGPVISTIPMPEMMGMVHWPSDLKPDFKWRPIWTTRGLIVRPKADLYQTLYYTDGSVPWYRISITGHEVIAEAMNQTGDVEGMEDVLDHMVKKHFGLPAPTIINWTTERRQEYGKLAPVDDQQRRGFILAMTDRYRIYSVGRFATWRQILLDDIVHDVEVVEKFITERDAYGRTMADLLR